MKVHIFRDKHLRSYTRSDVFALPGFLSSDLSSLGEGGAINVEQGALWLVGGLTSLMEHLQARPDVAVYGPSPLNIGIAREAIGTSPPAGKPAGPSKANDVILANEMAGSRDKMVVIMTVTSGFLGSVKVASTSAAGYIPMKGWEGLPPASPTAKSLRTFTSG